MNKAQKLMAEALEELLKAVKGDSPKNARKILKALRYPNVEVLEAHLIRLIRLDYSEQAQKEGISTIDWLKTQCNIMLSDPSYMNSISGSDKNDLSSFYSKLANGRWPGGKDDLMFNELRKRYQKHVSERTNAYIS